VAAVPQLMRDDLLGYLDDVYMDARNYLRETPDEKL
jgi:hypothetical protein